MMTLKTANAAPAAAELPYRADFKGPIVAGWAMLAVAFGGFGAWAVLAPLATGVTAGGTVVVDSNRKTIQHLEGGIVKQILVRDGDSVAAGQPLLRLDETQVEATLKLIRGRLDAALAQQARLSAERGGRDAVSFPDELRQRAAASTEVAEIIAGQEQLFGARRETLSSQVSVLENRIVQSETQIEGLQRQVEAKDAQIALIRKELAGKAELQTKGYASGVQVMEVERALARLEGERGETTAQIAQVQQAMNEAKLQILSQQISFRENVETELRKTEAEVFDLTERLAAVRAQHDRLVVTAPVAGTVVDSAAHTVGGVVAPGSRILDIVPHNDDLVVEAQVGTADVDDIHAGMPAEVRFSAFNRGNIPLVKGAVSTISADRLLNEKTGMPFYRVRVKVDPGSLGGLHGLQLLPGMPAEVLINKADRTLFDYFYLPFQELLTKSLRG